MRLKDSIKLEKLTTGAEKGTLIGRSSLSRPYGTSAYISNSHSLFQCTHILV